MLDQLNLPKFEQYSEGRSVLMYNSMAPVHYFESDSDALPAYRIRGGSDLLIYTLADHFLDKIMLNTKVEVLCNEEKGVAVLAKGKTFYASKVISTLPSQLAETISYTPPLAESLSLSMKNTHTWMGNAIKVGLCYKNAFWREKRFSGTIIGQVGPTIELYDHSDAAENHFGLIGFVNEGLRDLTAEDRKERILGYLETYLGTEVRAYTNYQEKDWSQDVFTCSKQLKFGHASPHYRNSLFQNPLWDHSLYFTGAETSPINGGYMDGAVYSTQNTAKKLLT